MKTFLVLLSLFGLTFAQDNFCEFAPDNSFIKSDQSHSVYFKCIGGVANEFRCSENQSFNTETSECTDNIEKKLTDPQPTSDCDGVEDLQYLPSQTSCAEYFQCIDGTPYLVWCPRGLYFSRITFRCVAPSEAECVLTTPSPPSTIPPPSTVTCDGVTNFRFLASPLSCLNFYQCIDGNAFLLSCPLNQHFDEPLQTCVNEENSSCSVGRLAPVETSLCEGVNNFRLIRSLTSCTEYYQCIEGSPFRLTCPRGLYFSEIIQSCDYPFYVDCVTNPSESTTSQPREVSCEGVENFRLIQHPTSCALYYQCIGEAEFLTSCPIGRYFDEEIQTCADSELVDCNDRTRRPTTTTQAPIIDPQCQNVEEGRLVLNIRSCTSYYQCIGGRAMPRFCDDGLWFDEGLQRCDDPANVNCQADELNTIPTVPTDEPIDICDGVPNETYVPSRTFCERFYFCINGNAYVNQCQYGKWFVAELQTCLPIDEVECSLITLPTTSTTTTTTDSSPTGMCREASNGTYIGNRMACNEFFVCISDEPHGRTCQDGLWFNFIQQRCVPPFETRCELDSIVCLGIENDVTIRAPASCSDFVTCVMGRPFPGRCMADMYFDEEKQICVNRDEVECDLDIPTEEPRHSCDGSPDFSLASSDEICSEYFVCYANEILFQLECPDDQNFDFATQVCGEEFECLL